MIDMPNIASAAPQGCPCNWPHGCLCPDEEKALRFWSAGDGRDMPTMTPEQREECLAEIEMVEGYRRKDYERASDANIATGVLQAWVDYARDKGLL